LLCASASLSLSLLLILQNTKLTRVQITGRCPPGWAGGPLTYASEKTAGSSMSYLSGFQTALQLISVAIGLTVGLGISLALVHLIQSRRRAGGVFSL
jgi:hypothetical protein